MTSLAVLQWALNDAGAVDAEELSVLMVLAAEADETGRGSFPTVETIVARTHMSKSTVTRRLRSLQQRGLIALGDQTLPSRRGLRGGRLPRVWDLLIPVGRLSTSDARGADA